MTLYIFDKDGTLCRGVPSSGSRGSKTHAPNRLEDQVYFDDILPVIAELKRGGHKIAIASNQGGVAFGIFSEEVARSLVEAAAHHIGADTFRVCCYHPKGNTPPYNADHPDRKPNTGMLISIMNELEYSPAQTIMVGDWATDEEAAQDAGCEFVWADEFFGR